MPQIRYQRLWCRSCQDWELFNHSNNILCCKECNAEHIKTPISEIPEEKVAEQRTRFKQKRISETSKFLTDMMSDMSRRDIFRSPNIVVTESDAGLVAKEKRDKELAKEKQANDLSKIGKYTDTKRNQSCPCGSNKKFKQCCYSNIQSLRLKYKYAH